MNISKNKIKNKGFTLIEILVAIAIIGILAAIVLVDVNEARKKARDVRRISNLQQIRTALEMYYAENGYYPQSDCGWDCNGYRRSYSSSSWAALEADLAPFLSSLPKDPINSSCSPWTVSSNCYSYAYGNVGRTTHLPQYDLTARLETEHSLICKFRCWRFYWDNSGNWCQSCGGSYSDYIYEASPQ